TLSMEYKIRYFSGVWHIRPTNECTTENRNVELNENNRLSTAGLIVLYAHGSGGSRDNHLRLNLYHVMTSQLQTHVVVFDYRGFGDSKPEDALPSAQGITNDTLAVFEWILSSGQISPKHV